jgi:hypothetical protein
MDYKEGFEKMKAILQKEHNQFSTLNRNFTEDIMCACYGLMASEICLIESEITKTQQECDHWNDGAKE